MLIRGFAGYIKVRPHGSQTPCVRSASGFRGAYLRLGSASVPKGERRKNVLELLSVRRPAWPHAILGDPHSRGP